MSLSYWPASLPLVASPQAVQPDENPLAVTRVATAFLSSLSSEHSPLPSSSPAKQPHDDEILPIRASSGDARTQYLTKPTHTMLHTSHRLFLSCDHAYPLEVFSLVVSSRPPAFSKLTNTTPALKAATSSSLPVPLDPTAFSLGGDTTTITTPTTTTTTTAQLVNSEEEDVGTVETSSDSSSDDEDHRHHHPVARGGPKLALSSVSYRFLLSDGPTSASSSFHLFSAEPLSTGGGGNGNNMGGGNGSPSTSSSSSSPELKPDAVLSWDADYSFHLLDDSKINQGKHRVVQNLSAVRFSILPYIKTNVLKQELNSLFAKKNPNLPEELTLSKLRRLKKIMLEITTNCNLELSTLALAFVYLEKLILKGVVYKANRKVVALTCLVIAFKFNESESLAPIMVEIDKFVPFSEIRKTEFAVFAHLHFRLHLPGLDYFEHFISSLRNVDKSASEYLRETPERSQLLLKSLSEQRKIPLHEEKPPLHHRDVSSATSRTSQDDDDDDKEEDSTLS